MPIPVTILTRTLNSHKFDMCVLDDGSDGVLYHLHDRNDGALLRQSKSIFELLCPSEALVQDCVTKASHQVLSQPVPGRGYIAILDHKWAK